MYRDTMSSESKLELELDSVEGRVPGARAGECPPGCGEPWSHGTQAITGWIERNSSRTSGAVQLQKEGEAPAASCRCRAKVRGNRLIARQRQHGIPATKLGELPRRGALRTVELDAQTIRGEVPGQDDGARSRLPGTAAGLRSCLFKHEGLAALGPFERSLCKS